MSKTIAAHAVRGFRDAGTGKSFTPGRHDFEAGAYGNYKAAGLVSDEPTGTVAATKAPTAPARKASAKAAAKGSSKPA